MKVQEISLLVVSAVGFRTQRRLELQSHTMEQSLPERKHSCAMLCGVLMTHGLVFPGDRCHDDMTFLLRYIKCRHDISIVALFQLDVIICRLVWGTLNFGPTNLHTLVGSYCFA